MPDLFTKQKYCTGRKSKEVKGGDRATKLESDGLPRNQTILLPLMQEKRVMN
jgi:hypothetical protein